MQALFPAHGPGPTMLGIAIESARNANGSSLTSLIFHILFLHLPHIPFQSLLLITRCHSLSVMDVSSRIVPVLDNRQSKKQYCQCQNGRVDVGE